VLFETGMFKGSDLILTMCRRGTSPGVSPKHVSGFYSAGTGRGYIPYCESKVFSG
jgi:hypothetical protein